MRPLSGSIRAVTVTLLALLVVASPAEAVKPRGKLRALGPVKVVKPFKGAAAKARPLASASALLPRGGFAGAAEPACCHAPSEIGGAVGETQVVQADAVNITVFSRTGPTQKTSSVNDFCGPGSSEPRVLYDRFLKRWFMVMITATAPQAICVFTSKTSSAAGAYHVIAYGLPNAGGLTRGLRIGMDTDGLFTVFDQYDAGNAYARSGAIAFSKAYLINGLPQSVGFYDALPRLAPPVVVDAARASSYFLAAGPDPDQLQLYKATAMHRGGPLAQEAVIPVPAYSGAVIADQPGVSENLLVDGSDFRGSSYQTSGLLMNAHTINRNGHPTVRWYAINVDDPSITRSGRLFESGTSDDFSPSVAAAGDSVFFSWASTDARHATASAQHGPRMRFAAYEVGDASTNKVGVAAATGTDYAPAPGVDHAWRGGQVTLAPKPVSSGCGDGTFAFAVGQFATAQDRWRGYVKKFGTC